MLRTTGRVGAGALTVVVFLWLPSQVAQAAFVGLGQAGNYSIFVVSNSNWSMNNSVIAGPMAAGAGDTYNWAGGSGPYGAPIYYQTGNTVPPVANLGGSPTPTAVATNLTQAQLDARAAATGAAGLTANKTVTGNHIINTTGTITLNAGENVVDLTDVTMTNGTVLLSGGANDTIIFRVSGQFSVGNSSIRVSGGLTPNHVLWYFPTSNSTIKSPNGAWDGTILALTSSVSFDNTPSTLGACRGAIIAADDVNNNQTWSVTAVSGFDLNTQSFTPVPEPAAALLIGGGFAAFGIIRPRRRQRTRSSEHVGARWRTGLAAPAAFLLFSAVAPVLSHAATINLGNASNYGVFGLGSTVGVGSADTLTGNTAEIYGNVAIGADTGSPTAAGDGSLQKGFIQGSLYVDGPTTPASYTIVNKNFTISGTVFGTVAANPGNNPDSVGTGTFNLVPAVQDAVNASSFYAGVSGQTALGVVNLNSSNQTLAAGNYSATSFLMNSGAVLTINGTASDTFVLNVSGGFDFTKSFIKLTGGITAGNVLFNVTGTGTTVSVTGDNSIFQGNLLAVSRDIDVAGLGTGSAQGVSFGPDGVADTNDDNPGYAGRIIGALSTTTTTLNLTVHSGAEVNAVVPEPASLTMLAGVGTAGLLLRRRRLR